MSEEKQPLRSPMVQIAVSGTPVDNPDRSLLKVFPKWLKVAKLWFQRERASETSTCISFSLVSITLRGAGEDKRKAQAFSLAAILLAAASTFLLLRISYAQAAFQTTMSKRDEGASFRNSASSPVLMIRFVSSDVQWDSRTQCRDLLSLSL